MGVDVLTDIFANEILDMVGGANSDRSGGVKSRRKAEVLLRRCSFAEVGFGFTRSTLAYEKAFLLHLACYSKISL